MAMDVRRRDALAHGLGAASLAALGAMGLPGCATPGPATPDDALGADDALGVAARIKAKEITALEAVDAAIARAERLEPKINAIVTRTFEDARERARAGAASGPFAGVPMLVKDLSDVAGQPTRFGCRGYRDAPPAAATDRFVAQAFAAGLISIGKSTTPEFGYTATTEPLLTGPTRNPWNLAHSAGGSSGGSAAAVAAGVAPIATASDGGGSIRIPASCCGLFGLKPSRGRLVGSEAPSAPVPISVAGCLSRSVRDAAAFLAATERADTPYPAIGLVTGPAKARLRVGLIIDAATGVAPDPEVRAATLSAAALCADLGHSVRETAYPFDGEAFTRAFTLYWSLGAAEVVAAYRKLYPEPPLEEAFEPLTLHLLRHAAKASRAEVDSAIAVLRRAGQQQAAMFDGLDVILTPVLLTPPPALGHLDVSLPFEENQARIARYVGYTPFENAAGAPAMSAPLGWSRSGLPIGAHFTARPGAEATLLALAYELEAARPWAQRRPRL